MSDDAVEFLWPEDLGIEEAERVLTPLARLRRRPGTSAERLFCDTVDRRVQRRGFVLEFRRAEGGPRLTWGTLQGETLRSTRTPLPRFAWDLPAGPFRERLEAVIEMRALLPVLRLRTRSETLELRDADGKVLCRVSTQRHAVGEAKGRALRPLPPRLRVEPVRGYGRMARRVREKLGRELALAPAQGGVFEAALAALGRDPGLPARPRVELAPAMPAGVAVRRILLRLLDTLEENEAGTRADVDSEFLHDYRVAVRRTRSALGQLKAALPPEVVERFRPGFARLGAVTTPTRDLDVHLLDFSRYAALLPEQMRPDLEPLRAFLTARQRREQKRLARTLGTRRHKEFLRAWRTFLEAPVEAASETPTGLRPLRELTDARLRVLFRRALREGRPLDRASPAEAFHELRKTCKKLRYLMEFFQDLYPQEDIRRFIEALKGLQDTLGEFQNFQVLSQELAGFAGEMTSAGAADPRTHLAIGMLVEKFRAEQDRLRREFGRTFGAFSAPKQRTRFAGLLRAPRPAEETAP